MIKNIRKEYLNFFCIARSHVTQTIRTICSFSELTVRASVGKIFTQNFFFQRQKCEIASAHREITAIKFKQSN